MSDADQPSQPLARVRSFSTTELFNGTREIIITHNGETYHLRITQRGRLILTK